MKAAVLGVALLLVAGTARADQSGARAHILSGHELYSQARYAAALAEYQAAWVTSDDPELLLDMAECNRHLGNLDAARAQYRGFLARLPRSPLRDSVERQLASVDQPDAPPPAELTVPSAPPTTSPHRGGDAGRTARILGLATWALSTVAIGVGIYTWQRASALESTAHAELASLTINPLSATPEERAFFANPTCSPPSSLAGTETYRRDCNRGQQYSTATTALFAGGLTLGAVGTVAYIVGAHLGTRARERTVAVAPIVGPSGGGLLLLGRF